MAQRSGLLIALEGIDGSGTTTQAARLGAYLRARGPVHLTREPSDGPIGQELRRILNGDHAPLDPAAVALLFAADRIDHLRREVEPALARGVHVISDRYVLSSLAYQGELVDRAFVAAANAQARPADLTLLIDVPAQVAAARRRARGGPEELFDGDELQARVAEAYRAEAARAIAAGERVVVVDGTAAVDQVLAALWAATETCLASSGWSSSS